MQIGMAAESLEENKIVIVNTKKLMQGLVYKGVMKSKARTYCYTSFGLYILWNMYLSKNYCFVRELLG